jgi:hypothetical protein
MLDDIAELASTMNESLMGGDYSSLPATADGLLAQVLRRVNGDGLLLTALSKDGSLGFVKRTTGRRKDPVDRVRIALEGVPITPFDYGYTVTYDPEDPFPHPYRKQDFSEGMWKAIVQKCSGLAFPGHFLHPGNSLLFGCACAFGVDNFKSNPIIQRLAFYVRNLKGEPARMDNRGRIFVNDDDIMSAIRVLTAINAALWYQDYVIERKMPEVEGVIIEIFEFIFNDPFYNTKLFKSWTNLPLKALFSTSASGTRLKWVHDRYSTMNPDMSLLDYTIHTITGNEDNDRAYFKVIAAHVNKDLNEISKHGMNATAVTLRRLISGRVDTQNYLTYTLIQGMIAIAGFTRTDPAQSHVLTIRDEFALEGKYKENVLNGDVPYAPYLADVWTRFVDWAHANHKFPKYEELRAMIPGMLTSKSAGGQNTTFDVMVPGRIPSVRSLAQTSNSTLVSYRSTDKYSAFMAAGDSLFNGPAPLTVSSPEFPGGVGSRQVTAGKLTRPIFLRHIYHFLHEVAIGVPLQMFQMKKNTTPFGNLFTVGSEKGNTLLDLALGFAVTSDPDYYAELADFSAFDTTQKNSNMRRIAKKAVISALIDRGYTSPYGKWKGGLAENVEYIWGRGVAVDAYYKTSSGYPSSEKILRLDMLQSGELMTLSINNMTNLANEMYFLDRFDASPGLCEKLRPVAQRYMGDDFAGIWHAPSPVSSETLDSFLSLREECAARNGLSINKQKTTMRSFFYEYLKKSAVYGRYVPLRHIQPFASERGNIGGDPLELIRSYASTLSTLVSRGLSHKLAVRILAHTWNVKRAFKYPVEKDVSVMYYLPFMALYVPTSMHGGGQLPYTLLGASKDMCIAIEAARDTTFRYYVNIAAHILDIKWSQFKDRVARSVEKGMTRPPNVFKPGQDFIRSTLLEDRMRDALEAWGRLRDKGAKDPGVLRYDRVPQKITRQIVEGNSRMVGLELAAKFEDGGKLLEKATWLTTNSVPDKMGATFGWLDHVRFTETERLSPQYRDSPFPCLSEDVDALFKILGVSQEKDVYAFNPSTIMDMLKDDPYFPRGSSAEQIFAYLASPLIYSSQDNITDALVMMGAGRVHAERVSAELHTKAKGIMMSQSVASFSYNDQIIPLLSQTVEAHTRLVEISPVADIGLERFLREVMYLYSVLSGFRRGYWAKVRLDLNDDAINGLNSTLYSKFYELEIMKYFRYNKLHAEWE